MGKRIGSLLLALMLTAQLVLPAAADAVSPEDIPEETVTETVPEETAAPEETEAPAEPEATEETEATLPTEETAAPEETDAPEETEAMEATEPTEETETPEEAEGIVEEIAANETAPENFNYNVVNGGACITGYTGSSQNVTIPEELGDYQVTAIGSRAFYGKPITRVVIPDTVTIINDYAFQNCTGLREVVLSERLSKLGLAVFGNCAALKKIEIPKSLTTADANRVTMNEAPFGGSGLSQVTFEEGTSRIPMQLFMGCKNLRSIDIPGSITTIESFAFVNSGLEEVTFHEGLEIIGSYAFQNTNLTKLKLPDTVTSINDYAFKNNANLADVTLSKRLTKLGLAVFGNCAALKKIEIPKSLTKADANLITIGEAPFEGSGLSQVTFEQGTTQIASYLFMGCKSLRSIDIPATVMTIGSYAFVNCGLEKVTFHEGLQTIGSYAFGGIGLTKVEIPDSVTKIEDNAFKNDTYLSEVKLPKCLNSLGYNAFNGCSSLKRITIPKSLERVSGSGSPFAGSGLTDVTFEAGIPAIPAYLFYNCTGVQEIVLPKGVQSIGYYAFAAKNLQKITIPGTVTQINNNAFYGVADLTIYGIAGSYAETFAKQKGYTFVDKSIPATSVTFAQTAVQLAVGESMTLVPNVTPKDYTAIPSWTSANEKVVTVDQTGTIKAVGAGTAKVTVTIGALSASCQVTVGKKVTDIRLSDTHVSLYIGQTQRLNATVSPSDATDPRINWYSSNTAVAKVSDDGRITAVGTGSATILAKAADGSGAKASCTVTVSCDHRWVQTEVTGGDTGHPTVWYRCDICGETKSEQGSVVELTGAPETMVSGSSVVLTARISDGSKGTFRWSLAEGSEDYATLRTNKSNTASVTLAVKAGLTEAHEVTVLAESENAVAGAEVTVTLLPQAMGVEIFLDEGETPVTGTTLVKDLNQVDGGIMVFEARVYPEDAQEQMTWTTSDTKGEYGTFVQSTSGGYVVRLDPDAKPALITLTAVDRTGKLKATVKLKTTRISTGLIVTPDEEEITLVGGQSRKFTATLEGSPVDKTVVWSVAPEYTAYATMKNGTLTAADVFEEHEIVVLAEAKDGGAVKEIPVTILPRATGLTVTVNGEPAEGAVTISRNDTDEVVIAAQPIPSQAQAQVVWSGMNSSFGEFSQEDGQLTITNLKKSGVLTLTAKNAEDPKSPKVTLKLTFTRHADTIEILSSAGKPITGPITVASGRSYTFKDSVTTGKDKDLTDKTVVWSVDQPEYAFIQNGKLTVRSFTAAAPVEITVIAALKSNPDVSAEQTVTLTPNAKKQIELWTTKRVDGTTVEASLAEGGMPLYVRGAQNVTWKSSSAAVVSVDNEGNLTFRKTGTANITAREVGGSAAASVKITVVNPVADIEILGGTAVSGGKTLKLTAKMTGATEGAKVTNSKVIWSLNPADRAYASISTSGVLTAKKITGHYQVQVTCTSAVDHRVSVSRDVDIYPLATAVVIRNLSDTYVYDLNGGSSICLDARVYPGAANQQVIWTSSNKSVTVDENGYVQVAGNAKAGTVTLTASAADGSGKKASVRINVARLMQDADLTMPEDLSVTGGKTLTIPAKVTGATNKGLDWTVSSTAWATIKNGKLTTKKVTGVKRVVVTATAKDGSGVQKSCIVTINPA